MSYLRVTLEMFWISIFLSEFIRSDFVKDRK